MKTIGFIGGGRITKIILNAFQNADIHFERILVYDINEATMSELKSRYPKIIITSNIEDPVHSELVVLATHPPVTVEVLEKIKEKMNPDAILLSLVPKITISKIRAVLGNFNNIARMNPSASTIINKGVNPVSFSSDFDVQKKKVFMELFQLLGYTPEVAEHKIEAYAVISAMGHTYFNFQIQKLQELAVSFGMDEAEAGVTISKMLLGTTETLFNSGMDYQEVADLVPVKPLAEVEDTIRGYYDLYLNGIFNKIKPA